MTDQVRAAHLLIKHTGSRNPVSRRTNQPVTLSPGDALVELQKYQNELQAKGLEHFPSFAEQRSDCSSCTRGGDLGEFGRGMMQKPFEDASFALNVGQMSGIVETDSGYHLIYRIA
jgi:parvulin-like peptidyl-prolyl isomerase